MIKKLFSYILSASLLVSSGQNVFANDMNLKNNDKNLERQKILKKARLMRSLKFGLLGCFGTMGVLSAIYATSPDLSSTRFSNKTNVRCLLSELRKEDLGITNNNIENVVACSAIQGLSYLEGANRYEQKGRHERLLNELIETIILIRSFDNLNLFFKLGAEKKLKEPELLQVSRTQGDGMVQKISHIFDTNEPQSIKPIKEAREYMNFISTEFDKLNEKQIVSCINELSGKDDNNINTKISLLISLTFIDMSPKKLTKLVNTAVNNMYIALDENKIKKN